MSPVVECLGFTIPDPPPAIDIPGYGSLVAARRSIHSITDPAEFISQLQNQLTAAMAPLKRYLDMLDAMMAVRGCMTAIPEAILTLNPSAITDCLENLYKAIAVLLSYVPPMAYIKMGCDIARFGILCIDELTRIFQAMDMKMTQYIQSWELAKTLVDSELMRSQQCAAEELKALTLNLFPLIRALSIAMDVFLDFMLKFYPVLKELAKTLKDEMLKLDEIEEAITAGNQYLPQEGVPEAELIDQALALHEIIPVPPLGFLFETLNKIRNVAAFLYNTLAPFVGLDADQTVKATPEFVNF